MNYHQILGVKQNSSKEEITKAYRKLAKIWHPDTSGIDSTKKFQEINNAYEFLIKNLGRSYTTTHHYNPPKKPEPPKSPKIPSLIKINQIEITQEEIDRIKCQYIDNIKKGRSIVVQIQIPKNEIAKVLIKKKPPCGTCCGIKGSENIPCCCCQGKGYINEVGELIIKGKTCLCCEGMGSQNFKCEKCSGSGFEKEFAEEIEVFVPTGTKIGYQMHLKDKGEADIKGRQGDIYIIFV